MKKLIPFAASRDLTTVKAVYHLASGAVETLN